MLIDVWSDVCGADERSVHVERIQCWVDGGYGRGDNDTVFK